MGRSKLDAAVRAEQREAILEAANTLFTRHGLGNVTSASIAREAGISAGAIYLTFRSLVELQQAWLDERSEMSETERALLVKHVKR